MVLEQVRSYRLGPRGGPSVACDGEGVSLGGVALVSVAFDAHGHRRCDVRTPDQVTRVLNLAYGPQSGAVAERLQRGLRRIATLLEKADLAVAGIEAVMLRLPDLNAEGHSKLATLANLEKGGSRENEPRVPPGESDGGQWTTGGGRGGSAPRNTPPRAGPRRSAARRPPVRQATPQTGADPGDVIAVSRTRESRKQNPNGFYENSAGGGTFYIPSVSAGHQIRPTEVHALDANAYQVAWGDGVIKLKHETGAVYSTAATLPDIAHFNSTTGQNLGVSIYVFPGEAARADAAPALVDFTNGAAGALVDTANWLQQPATHVPILPEIAGSDPTFPMGAAWAETTDPTAFQAWRPVSHLEVAGDVLSVAGALAPVGRVVAGADASTEIAAAGDAAVDVAAESQTPITQLGGAYKNVRGLPGYAAHHMPADSVSPLSRGEGPSFALTKEDHQLTASWGNSRQAHAARQAQADLIAKGDFRGAQQMDVKDVQRRFGAKYDEAIRQMLVYSKNKGLW